MKTTNTHPKNGLINSVLVIGLTAALGLAGCDQKGPAEKAGQKIDQAADNAKQNIDNATDNAKQKLETAKDALGQKADQAGALIDQSTEASQKALEKTEKNMDRLNENVEQKIEQAKEGAEKNLEAAKDVISNQAESATAYVDDSVITLKVKAAIDNDPALKASKLTVSTVDGVVKVSGSVDSLQSQARVVEVINSQPNVKSVQTDLVVNANTLGK
jgi:hyperosmotically inducible periplasmic protein